MYYRRSKTYGHLSILVEPEIRELMDRVSDEKNLISRRGEYQAMMSFVNRNAGKACVRVGLPKITSYWMRHSYATLLYELSKFDRNITKDDISSALDTRLVCELPTLIFNTPTIEPTMPIVL